MPRLRRVGLPSADGTVKGEQEEKSHEGLAALDNIGDRFGLERMDCPEQGTGKGKWGGDAAIGFPETVRQESSADDAEERQRRQDVDHKIEEMITPGPFTTDGTI